MTATAAQHRQALATLHGTDLEAVQLALSLPVGRPTQRQLRLKLWTVPA